MGFESGVYRERREWNETGIPVRVLDNWAMETLVRSWVHLSRHGEFAHAAYHIAEVGRQRWGARWEYAIGQVERSEMIEEMWYIFLLLLVLLVDVANKPSGSTELDFDPKF